MLEMAVGMDLGMFVVIKFYRREKSSRKRQEIEIENS